MELPYSCEVGAANSKAGRRVAPASKPKRRPGRPRRADAPVVDWAAVDRLLVFGERHVDPATGLETVRYPSLVTIAERYGVSRNLIWVYSNKSKCYVRRKEARAKTLARTDEKLIEKVSEARALATSDVVGVADQFLMRFEKELREGRVKTDSAADFDRVARLRELMLGRSDSRSELHGELSLSAIQERHRRLRSRTDGLTPEVTGTADGPLRELSGVQDASGGVQDAGGRELAGDELGVEDLR
jgi:hypothetical protein